MADWSGMGFIAISVLCSALLKDWRPSPSKGVNSIFFLAVRPPCLISWPLQRFCKPSLKTFFSTETSYIKFWVFLRVFFFFLIWVDTYFQERFNTILWNVVANKETGAWKIKITQFISSQRTNCRNPLPTVASLPHMPAGAPVKSTTNSDKEGSPEENAFERAEASRQLSVEGLL